MVLAAPVMVFGLWLAIRSVRVPVAERPNGREAAPMGLAERTGIAPA